jgi:hypothetical protein
MTKLVKLNYLDCINKRYPEITVEASDPFDYFTLIWREGPDIPSKEQLDSDIFLLYRIDAVDAVDRKADEVYFAAVSTAAKLLEYLEAEYDARRYLADNTVVAPYVYVWAQATGWSMEEAANDILKTANTFRQILIYVRAERLKTKQQIRTSPVGDELAITNSFYQFATLMDGVIYQIKMGT